MGCCQPFQRALAYGPMAALDDPARPGKEPYPTCQGPRTIAYYPNQERQGGKRLLAKSLSG